MIGSSQEESINADRKRSTGSLELGERNFSSAQVQAGDHAPAATVQTGDLASAVPVQTKDISPSETVQTADFAPATTVQTGDLAPLSTVQTGDHTQADHVQSGDLASVAPVQSRDLAPPATAVQSGDLEPEVSIPIEDIKGCLDNLPEICKDGYVTITRLKLSQFGGKFLNPIFCMKHPFLCWVLGL